MVVLAGLAGPLLGASGRFLVPVVVGELLAGLVLGGSGFGWLRPDEPTTAFLADIGFAMLMFTAGMHVPLGNPALVRRLGRGAFAALVVAGSAVAAGWLAADLAHVGHPAVYAVVLGSGSAAVLVPERPRSLMPAMKTTTTSTAVTPSASARRRPGLTMGSLG